MFLRGERHVDGRVLSIAGSDSGGGAGIQADIKTIGALGGFATTAITAVTAQNTFGVAESLAIDALLVERQVEVVLDDIGADAIKTGMLANRLVVELVARQLERSAGRIPVVVDPVMRSTTGSALLDTDGIEALKRRLLPHCALVTPNLEEARILTGVEIEDERGMQLAADRLLLLGANAVLVTGGHLPGEVVVDLLRTADGMECRFEAERLETRCTHGTGCTLSAAVAVGIAQGMTLQSAVERALDFVRQAMLSAVPLGKGPGCPLDHGFALRPPPPSAAVH